MFSLFLVICISYPGQKGIRIPKTWRRRKIPGQDVRGCLVFLLYSLCPEGDSRGNWIVLCKSQEKERGMRWDLQLTFCGCREEPAAAGVRLLILFSLSQERLLCFFASHQTASSLIQKIMKTYASGMPFASSLRKKWSGALISLTHMHQTCMFWSQMSLLLTWLTSNRDWRRTIKHRQVYNKRVFKTACVCVFSFVSIDWLVYSVLLFTSSDRLRRRRLRNCMNWRQN